MFCELNYLASFLISHKNANLSLPIEPDDPNSKPILTYIVEKEIGLWVLESGLTIITFRCTGSTSQSPKVAEPAVETKYSG